MLLPDGTVQPGAKGDIFVCDEMKINVAATLVSLEKLGYQVKYYANASEGWAYLMSCFAAMRLPELFIIDMALLPGTDEESFPGHEIDEGQTTGIYLIRKIFDDLSSSLGPEGLKPYRSRTILYTRVQEEYYVKKAKDFSVREGIRFITKRINDGGDFLKAIVAIVEE